MDPADQQLLDLIGEELKINQENLLESLNSNNSNIRIKALTFANNNYTKIKPQIIKQAIQFIPKLLQTTQSQILSKTIDFIIKMSNVTFQRYLDVEIIIFNLLKYCINQSKQVTAKSTSVQAILIKFIDSNEFVNILLSALNLKNFHSINNALNFLLLGLAEFGGSQLNYLDSVLPILERLLTNSNAEFRTLLVGVYKEIFKYIGNKINRSLRYFQQIEQLEIVNFTKTWGNNIVEGRREQIQQAKQMSINIRQASYGSQRQLQKQKTKFWDNYQESWMYQFQKTTKWKGRLEILQQLKKDLQNNSNIGSGNYKNIYMILQTCLSDPNFHIQLISIKIIKIITSILKSNFKEMHYLFQFMLPFFKKKDERITKYLFQCFMEFMNYLKIQQIIEELKSALKSKNSIYKINVLKFTLQLVEKKIQQNKMNEVKYLYDHFASIFKRLDIDPNKEIRQAGKDLMNLLIQQTIDNNSLRSSSNSESYNSRKHTLLKLKTELSQNISEIKINPEKSNKKLLDNQEENNYSTRNLRRNFSNQVLRMTGLKQTNSFLKNDYGRRTQLLDQRNQFELDQDDYDIGRRVSNMSNNKYDISDNDQEFLKLMERRNSQQQQMNIQIKEPFLGNELDLSQCQQILIDWEQRDKNKLLQQLEQYIEGKILRAKETNEILYELQKNTNQFREINSNKNFVKFLTTIINFKTLEIDEETFTILRNEIAKNIQKDKNCRLSFAFMEKLLMIQGPYRFFEIILQELYQRGFNHRNFVWILYQLTRRIPEDLFYDGHVVLLHRNLLLFFDGMDFQKEFLNLLHHIISKKIHYLRKSFSELNYINFSEIKEIKEVDKINFHVDIQNEFKALKKNFLNEDVAHYKSVDITDELENFVEESRINLNKKKSILDKLFLILLKNAKFILKTQKIDDKLQVLLLDCLNGQEYNKKILKLLSKIYFVYSHCNENLTFKFQDKILKTFLPIFLKEKNNDTRQYFAFTLKKHFSNEKMSQIPYYCKFLYDKSANLKIELLQILFDFFDNQTEENILKVKKSKVFPPLFEQLKNKNKVVKTKASEFLEFLLTFFSQKNIIKIAKKCSKEAQQFVEKFYQQNQQPTEIKQENESEVSSQTITLRESMDQTQFTPNLTQNLKSQLESIISKQNFQNQKSEIKKQNTKEKTKEKKRYSKTITDQNNFIYFQELEKIPIQDLIQNLEQILENVFIFQISEIIKSILFTDESDDIDALFNIMTNLISSDNILQINIIPLYLSIFFNLQEKFPYDKEINQSIFKHLLQFCDSLRSVSEEPVCLISEEFQLFMEIIELIKLENIEDQNLMDQMILTIVLDHIDFEDTMFVLNNLESEDFEQQRLFIIPIQQGELHEDLLGHYENVESFYRLLFNFAFGTENLILDIILKNQFFQDLNEEEQILSIFIFSIVLKRIKKSIINQNYVNEKFLNFFLEKCYDYLNEIINQANDIILKDFLTSLVSLCNLKEIQSDIIFSHLFKWVELLQTSTLVYSLCDVNFDDKEQNEFVCKLLIEQLENEDTQQLVSYAQDIQDRINLNRIGQYLVNLQKTKALINKNKSELEDYSKLIEEYNNFNWQIKAKQFIQNILFNYLKFKTFFLVMEIEGRLEQKYFKKKKLDYLLNQRREVGTDGCWTLSSAKQGNGIYQLRDDNQETFWQSDGPIPHLVTIEFPRKTQITEICIYLDLTTDESYTPEIIQIKGGIHQQDLRDIANLTLENPIGWIVIPLKDIYTMVIQIQVKQMFHSGKDTHVRMIKIFTNKDPKKKPNIYKGKDNSLLNLGILR